jgi:hypothetical protein
LLVVVEPGKIAGWIAPPERGINNLPVEYEYVRLNCPVKHCDAGHPP